MEDNLWPSFGDIPKISTPKKILAEQAAFLEKSTSNFLKAEVRSHTLTGPGYPNPGISHSFVIIAPFLSNYSFTLFKLTHDVAFIYPAQINSTPKGVSYNILGEESLRETLRGIFSDERTIGILNNLLIQSKATSEN